ncbi:MAG: cytochrome c biogenesis protein CcsA, partial [Candidatus Polarisedimenticolia bacterium]
MNGLFWQRILLAVTTLAIAVCITVVFAVVPGERTMGAVQRIFYFHVPSAINAFLGVALCALFSLLYLWRRERRFDILAHGSAELAVLFCSIVLITGPLWARPVWGVWWTGEVRLTSTLVLWLILVGYLVLRASAENPDQAARWGAVVA